MQTTFLRLLAAATERGLWLQDRATPITRLVAGGNRITIFSCVSGVDQPLAVWNAWNLHFLVVACIAFLLAGPTRPFASRLPLAAFTLGLVGIMGLILCFAEVRNMAAIAAHDAFGVLIDEGKADGFLERMGRTIIVLGMLAAPAFAFLSSYVGSWAMPPSGRDDVRGPTTASAAACGVVVLMLGALAVVAGRLHPPDPLEALRRIQALNPSSPRPAFSLGVYHEARGQLGAAAEAYRDALEIDPTFAAARYALGNVFFTEGRLQEAEAAYRETLRLDPAHVSARENLGILLYRQGDYPGAERCFSEVLRADPLHAAAHHNLGLTLIGLDRRCEALPYLRRGSNLDRSFAGDVALQADIARLEQACRPR
jgi:tetratricopeptide (TPR) repeat protein